MFWFKQVTICEDLQHTTKLKHKENKSKDIFPEYISRYSAPAVCNSFSQVWRARLAQLYTLQEDIDNGNHRNRNLKYF